MAGEPSATGERLCHRNRPPSADAVTQTSNGRPGPVLGERTAARRACSLTRTAPPRTWRCSASSTAAQDRLAGTLYGALARLEDDGMIEALPGEGRRRPYGITPRGAQALAVQLTAQRRVASIGLRRLSTAVTS
jgi:hypothetical protein